MSRTWLWVGIAVVALGILGGVFAVARHNHWDDNDHTYRIVSSGDDGSGDRVVVVDDGRHWGGPPFFPVFPFVVIGGVIIVLAVTSGRRRAWHRSHWADRDFDEWHREAHWNWGSTGPRQAEATPPPTERPKDE